LATTNFAGIAERARPRNQTLQCEKILLLVFGFQHILHHVLRQPVNGNVRLTDEMREPHYGCRSLTSRVL